jgi:hypothetical protein
LAAAIPKLRQGLAKIAFEWMVREAVAASLIVDPAVLARELGGDPHKSAPDPNARLHNSMNGLWPLAEFVPVWSGLDRIRVNLFSPRYVPEGALIHKSVGQRAGYARRIPASHRIES